MTPPDIGARRLVAGPNVCPETNGVDDLEFPAVHAASDKNKAKYSRAARAARTRIGIMNVLAVR